MDRATLLYQLAIYPLQVYMTEAERELPLREACVRDPPTRRWLRTYCRISPEVAEILQPTGTWVTDTKGDTLSIYLSADVKCYEREALWSYHLHLQADP